MASKSAAPNDLPERVAVAVAQAISERKPSAGLSDLLELVVKAVTFGGLLASALGFFALYRQFDRLGVPTYLITLTASAQAGLLPTTMLVLAIVFSLVASRYREGTRTGLTIFGVSFGVIATAAGCSVIIPGLLVGVPWLAHFPIAGAFEFEPVARLFAGVGLGLGPMQVILSYMAALAFAAAVAIEVQRQAKTSTTPAPDPDSTASSPGSQAEATETKTGQLSVSSATAETIVAVAGIVVGLMAYAAMCLGGLRWLSTTLGLGWPLVTDLTNHDVILWSLVVTAAGAAAALAAYAFLQLKDARWDGWRGTILTTLAMLGFLAFFVVYSMFYPFVTPALGGGLPQRVTLWTGQTELESELLAASRRCVRTATLVRCEGVMTISAGDRLILLSKANGPPLVIATAEVKAIRLAP